MKSFIIYIVSMVLGLLAGFAVTWNLPVNLSQIKIGPWASDWSIGAEHANPYLQAHVARWGILALRKEEAVYFIANKDDEGQRLQERCDYRVTGGELPADWWSITLYDKDAFLPDNGTETYSFDATDTVQGTAWSFVASTNKPGGGSNWLPSKNAGQFDLMLRLYRPSEALLSDPKTALNAPKITLLGCADA